MKNMKRSPNLKSSQFSATKVRLKYPKPKQNTSNGVFKRINEIKKFIK